MISEIIKKVTSSWSIFVQYSIVIQFREDISVENVLEAEVYIRRGGTLQIEEQTSKKMKVKMSRCML